MKALCLKQSGSCVLEACSLLKSLLKRNFPYETFSSNFLRRRSFEALRVAICEGLCIQQGLFYQQLRKNLMTIAGASRIAALKKFRNSSLEMF